MAYLEVTYLFSESGGEENASEGKQIWDCFGDKFAICFCLQ